MPGKRNGARARPLTMLEAAEIGLSWMGLLEYVYGDDSGRDARELGKAISRVRAAVEAEREITRRCAESGITAARLSAWPR